MDQDRFDDITKSWAEDSDRRSVIKRLAGGLLGGVLALGATGVEAKKRRHGRRCAKAGVSCVNKECCQGFTCDQTTRTCVAKTTPPPPPPPVCLAPGTPCNPKDKNFCGDVEHCECVAKIDDLIRGTFHYECAPIEVCRPTFFSCTVGAPAESRFDCCSGNDYCKPVRGKKGFCKPRPTCPVHNQCTYEYEPCGDPTDDKGCLCRKFKHEWLCVFHEDSKGGARPVE